MRKTDARGNTVRYDVEPTGERLLRQSVVSLEERLPESWLAALDSRKTQTAGARSDAVLTITAPDGTRGRLLIAAKRRLDPKLVPIVVDQLRPYRGEARGGMVVAGYLSPRTRDLLSQARLSYADATGNIRLILDRPAVYIATEGAESDPWAKPGDRPLRSLKGPSAGRIVRALCDFRPPFRVEQLVKQSGASLGSVARVFELLDREGLILREPRGPVTQVRWADLIRRWAEDYAFARTNTTRSFLEPRGLAALQEKLRSWPLEYAVTGSLVASRFAPIAAPRLATLYVRDLQAASAELLLRPAETGANVLLAEPFDPVVFERSVRDKGLRCAALSQVAVDLLTGPGRSPAEGEQLLRWMEEHEGVWRAE